jgi:hypothetical protein
MKKNKSNHAIKMAEDYFKSFEGFWTEFEKLPEGFRFLLLNNVANYATLLLEEQKGYCWMSVRAIQPELSLSYEKMGKLASAILQSNDPIDVSFSLSE